MKCPQCRSANVETSRFCAERGTKLDPSEATPASHTETLQTPNPDLTTGSTFAGKYQIIEELGRGGWAEFIRLSTKRLDAKSP